MEGWKESVDNVGYLEKTVPIGNCRVTIYRPILTEEERSIREQRVIDALKQLYKE